MRWMLMTISAQYIPISWNYVDDLWMGADKANNKQIGKRSGHYRITGFLVILMLFFCRRWEV